MGKLVVQITILGSPSWSWIQNSENSFLIHWKRLVQKFFFSDKTLDITLLYVTESDDRYHKSPST